MQLTAEKIAVDVVAIGCSDDGAVNSLCKGYVLYARGSFALNLR